MTNDEQIIRDNNLTDATHAVIDDSGYLKLYHKYINTEGDLVYSIGEKYLPRAIKIEGQGFQASSAIPVIKGGTYKDIRYIFRDEQGNIKEDDNKSIPADLKKLFEDAEAKKKEVLGK